jgi:hypothetical protein
LNFPQVSTCFSQRKRLPLRRLGNES